MLSPIGLIGVNGVGRTSMFKSVDHEPMHVLFNPLTRNVAVPVNVEFQSMVTVVSVPESVAAVPGVIAHSYEVAFAILEME